MIHKEKKALATPMMDSNVFLDCKDYVFFSIVCDPVMGDNGAMVSIPTQKLKLREQ